MGCAETLFEDIFAFTLRSDAFVYTFIMGPRVSFYKLKLTFVLVLQLLSFVAGICCAQPLLLGAGVLLSVSAYSLDRRYRLR